MGRLITAACLALACFGCDDHDDGHGHEHDHDLGTGMSDLETGCQHFEYGPHFPDFAAAAEGELPELMPHGHYTVAVPADGGEASFSPHGAGMYIVMLSDAAAMVSATDSAGAAVAPMASADPGEECAAAAVAHTFMFPAGTYTLRLSGVASVEVVIHGPIGGEHVHGEAAGDHMHGEGGAGS